jgi:hypothetical protein
MLTKLVANFRDLGATNVLYYGMDRFLRMFSSDIRVYRFTLFALRVSDVPALPPHRGKSIDVHEVSSMDPVLVDLATDLSEDVLRFRNEQNAICFAAFAKGEVIGCIWVCFGTYYEDEVRCRFSPLSTQGACWDFGLYIKPEYRNSVAFAKMWNAVKQYLQTRGVCWSMSRISAFNPRSIKSHARAGAVSLGDVTFFCAGPYQLTVSRLRPFWHFSQDTDSIPHFCLEPPGENESKYSLEESASRS